MRFTKMQGCGNDYVFVDTQTEEIPPKVRPRLARRISDRHFGVGSDGLILISRSKRADFEMEMYNADGSRAQMCGNGIRCVAKYLYDRKKVPGRRFWIESAGTPHLVEILETRPDGPARSASVVRVDMGQPRFLPDQLVGGRTLFCVSMGNPHAVLFLREEEPWAVETDGPYIETAPCFPERTNAEFVKVTGRREISMRVWERGSGETLACGSGACACAAVCIQKGLTDEEITVKLLGGALQIAWDGRGGDLFLTGPAREVYEGEYPARW